jgi:hypothetical protein
VCSKRILNIVNPVSTSIFVYIAVASAMNNLAPGGMSSREISDMSDLESTLLQASNN